MRRIFLILGLITTGLTGACSKQNSEQAASLDRYPKPIEIYDDSTEAAAAEKSASSPQPTAASLAEFECAAGATRNSALEVIERSQRDDGTGEILSVENYDPTGHSVFGIPADGLERFTSSSGWSGVAAYVTASPQTLLTQIQRQFPGTSSTDGQTVTGAGLAGTITLEPATEGTVRIQCAAAR